MQKNIRLEIRRNIYFLVILGGSYLVVASALSMIVMPLFLHLVLFACASLSFLPSFLRHLTGRDIKSLDIHRNKYQEVVISLPNHSHQPTSWKVTWRSRRLVVFLFFFGWLRLPRSLWISPHSLVSKQEHRKVRILTRFNMSSAQKKKEKII